MSEPERAWHRTYQTIQVEDRGAVALVRLNRPQALNALNAQLMEELLDALRRLDQDDAVRAIVLTGNGRAFAAGADIKEMAERTVVDMELEDRFATWDAIRLIHKPIIAAVNGFALGGGCELAMMCDIIIAAETATFGQPEIAIGVIPGAGGTQRLTRAVGKSAAMEMILTGDPIPARRALELGLVSRVVAPEVLLDEALRLAQRIAERPPLAVRLGKDAVNRAFETTLTEGLAYERRNFYLLFATEDQKEGMRAFMEKRPPQFRGR
ncbi:MAG: enoyl-CoA hydratase/isomerase family protein [Clostridia bacterium]|nr:enoyl-CoA hydratase/isomerase family protein [Clostridia bacterium]